MKEKLTQSMRSEIIVEWVAEVKRAIPSAGNLEDPIIVDTIPCFLEKLAEAVEKKSYRHSANEANNVAEEHGGERARVADYNPQDVIQEYIILREVVLRKLKPLDLETLRIVQRSFDEAIKQSMMAFHLTYHEIREVFVNHLTHDLRTPLITANLTLDLLSRKHLNVADEELRAELQDLVQRAKTNLNYGHELINSMLDQSWVKKHKEISSQKFKPAEMKSIIQNAISEFAEDERDRIVLMGPEVRGHWDELALRRMAANLISNALKYGHDRTPITIRVSSIHGRALVAFHNEGNPIAVEDRGLLFNNLYRTDDAKLSNKKGWGLGLSYCRMVVEEHRGSMNIESSAEVGTTFTVDIPLDPRAINKT